MNAKTVPPLIPLPSVTVHEPSFVGLVHGLASLFKTLNQIIASIVWLPIIVFQRGTGSAGVFLLAVWAFVGYASLDIASKRLEMPVEQTPDVAQVPPEPIAPPTKAAPLHRHTHPKHVKNRPAQASDTAGAATGASTGP